MLGEPEQGLAVETPCRRAQGRDAAGVDALQPMPANAALGVVVVEQVDKLLTLRPETNIGCIDVNITPVYSPALSSTAVTSRGKSR